MQVMKVVIVLKENWRLILSISALGGLLPQQFFLHKRPLHQTGAAQVQ